MKLDTILQKFGLTTREANTYLATLELGTASVQKIAEKSGLVRSTTYEVLEHLRTKGLVSTYLKKKTRYYSAEDPKQVLHLAEGRVDVLKHALPELEALAGKSRHRPTVRFYQGKEEMSIIFKEILNEAKELIGFSSGEDLFRELPEVHLKFVEGRLKIKIPLRIILPDSALARERQKIGPSQLRTVKIMPPKTNFHGLIYIWKNKIAEFSFAGDFVATVTESQELADMQRAWFEALWNLLP